MKTTQKEAFLSGEGDAWIARNEEKLAGPAAWLVQLEKWFKPGMNVLEVGSGNGRNVRWLNTKMALAGSANGIDPATGGNPCMRGTADDLGMFNDEDLDVVVHGFELYLVDRDLLPAVVAETHRVLKPGGLVIIHDFNPRVSAYAVKADLAVRANANGFAVQYEHAPGLWSYHQDYAALFMAFGYAREVQLRDDEHDEVTEVLRKPEAMTAPGFGGWEAK